MIVLRTVFIEMDFRKTPIGGWALVHGYRMTMEFQYDIF